MWVFDGEEWTQDDGGEAKAKRDTTRQRLEELPFAQPQLQIVDVTELWKRKKLPPFPLP